MGCVYSSYGNRSNNSSNKNSSLNHQDYQPASSSSQEFQITSQDAILEPQRTTLFLDPTIIDVEMNHENEEGNTNSSTPLKNDIILSEEGEKMKKLPPSPFVPTKLLEGRSFLQSPLGKKQKPLVEWNNSPTRKRLSGKQQFNDIDQVKIRIFLE